MVLNKLRLPDKDKELRLGAREGSSPRDRSAQVAVFLVCQIMCKINFVMKIHCLKSSHKSYLAEAIN